ncbi:conserved hypothetical protein [Hyella patelloides LEGE 07179]|uniref:Uncharacterized protein n=1 Tax=Hyella patelloides LEGE 07179 TaxID=945734 RepID=A0A563VRW0_9CYAN|nr:transposase [Hyella patelloides]VEP14117.1 conserved hypothetical protein [Hyella patelloides LEGE 07179]
MKIIPKIEPLAQIYLNGKPAKISDITGQELCDWLMGEFQQLPVNIIPSDLERYETAQEMLDDLSQERLYVSGQSYDTEVYPQFFCGFAFQAIHDYDHYQNNSDFNLSGEIASYRATANRAPSLEIQKILYSEIVLKSAARLYLGHEPESKIVFA